MDDVGTLFDVAADEIARYERALSQASETTAALREALVGCAVAAERLRAAEAVCDWAEECLRDGDIEESDAWDGLNLRLAAWLATL